jgi:ubiquitin carboxyl-terminal hydrolase 25/28
MVNALKNTATFIGSSAVNLLMEIEGISDELATMVDNEAKRLEVELKSLRTEVLGLKVELEGLWKDEQMAEYELTSVFIHRGSSPSWGHYFFYARNLPDKPDEWFKYNDSTVSMAKKEDVLTDTTGSTANPYLVSVPVLRLNWR